MPNLLYSSVELVICVAMCLVTRSGYCQQVSASTVTVKSVLEFRIDIDKVDVTNSSTSNYTALVRDMEAQVKNTTTQGVTIGEESLRVRPTDGLCQLYFTLKGDPQMVSAALILLAQLTYDSNGQKIPVTVGFESKGRQYKVTTDQVCGVRRVLQPCDDEYEECSLGSCKPRQHQEITTGNLIVLGYAAAFILALVLVILFCFYRVAYLNNKRNKNMEASTRRSVGIENRAFWDHA